MPTKPFHYGQDSPRTVLNIGLQLVRIRQVPRDFGLVLVHPPVMTVVLASVPGVVVDVVALLVALSLIVDHFPLVNFGFSHGNRDVYSLQAEHFSLWSVVR